MNNEKPRRSLPYGEYVCPHCFNQIVKCSCDALPRHLILIDEGIQEHVRILNDKGYATMFCCESHSVHQNLYIAFAYAYGFGGALPGPEGFKCKNGGKTVERIYGRDSRARKEMTAEAFEAEKKKSLESLLAWAKALPENTGPNTLRGGMIGRNADARCPLPAGASVEEILDGYMCLHCGESLAECTCEYFPPQSTSLLDRQIRRHAKVLNEKGYEFLSGCAGHGPGSSVRVKLHMPSSKRWVDYPPEGFEFTDDRGWTVVEHCINTDLSEKQAEEDRNQALASLYEWCEALPKHSYADAAYVPQSAGATPSNPDTEDKPDIIKHATMAFWAYGQGVKGAKDDEAYKRACVQKQILDALEELPVQELSEKLDAVFANWDKNGDCLGFQRDGYGYIRFTHTKQMFLFECDQTDVNALNAIIDVFYDMRIGYYDPDTRERFDPR